MKTVYLALGLLLLPGMLWAQGSEKETALLGKADTNGYFKVEDGIYHLEAELNEKNVGRRNYFV